MIRPATVDDAYTLARMRKAMWDEMHPGEFADADFVERTYVYWYETLASGRAWGWIVEDQGEPIGCATMLLYHNPPLPDRDRRRGYVTGVYVASSHRRQGLGRELMETMIAHGHEHNLGRLELRTSEMGRPLYESLGFEPNEVLILKLEGTEQR